MSAPPRSTIPEAMRQALLAYQAGRLADAAKLCDLILQADPRNLDAINLAGAVSMQAGDLRAALAWFDRALALDARFAEAFNNRGVVLQRLGRSEEALESYRHARAIAPNHVDAIYNEGVVLGSLRRWQEALQCYSRLLELEPRHVRAWNNCGNVLEKLQRREEALERYARAIELRPDYVEALSNAGAVLNQLDRNEEALRYLDRALALRPAYPEALNNRGAALRELKRRDEALASYARALELDPGNAEALTNRGLALQDLRRWDEAQASYEHAIALRPDSADAHWNLSLLCLARGDFERGWKLFEWRWKTEHIAPYVRRFPQPLWLGAEDVKGKTLFVHAEQGLGDTIQFARYVALAESAGADVILESPAWLAKLMASLSPTVRVVTKGAALPEFDFHCPMASLPLALWPRMPGIPTRFPYLSADSALRDEWRRRLGAKTRPRIGIAWSGNPKNKIDRARSIEFARLAPLLHSDLELHSLQKEIRPADREAIERHGGLRTWCDELRDFADTAALIDALDLVLSVDTAVAHLAGALGKATWAMLPVLTDYRWPDREASPWYPETRIFRQKRGGDWDEVIQRVAQALREAFPPGRAAT